MLRRCSRAMFCVLCCVGWIATLPAKEVEQLYKEDLDVDPKPIASDKTVKYDYDIVYVRAPRNGDRGRTLWADVGHPQLMDPGADLMLLHPDGREELLVAGGDDGAIVDPSVSFDGQWVFFSHVKGLKEPIRRFQSPTEGADLYKLHVASRKLVRLTEQVFTPDTGAADWSADFRAPEENKNFFSYGVLNLGPYPLPGGRLVFVSNRNGFSRPKHGAPCLQLFTMDDDGRNVELIAPMNLGTALHPVVLTDGRVMFNTLESQGIRSSLLWGLWAIRPDGTRWEPLLGAFQVGQAPGSFHFQTQLSDGHIIAEEYYNANNDGLGSYVKIPLQPPADYPAFGPGDLNDPRNAPVRFGRHYNGRPQLHREGFSPAGLEGFTRFALPNDVAADPSVLSDPDSPRVGKFTHPSAAPDNHLLTVWTPGPANHQNSLKLPAPDGGIYLIKSGKPIDEPGQMLLIKNDPNYNEIWPRALVSYKRIYAIDEPKRLTPLANDGSLSPYLPAGSPFGLIGTSSLYKRESFPKGTVPKDSVTAVWTGEKSPDSFDGLDPFNTSQNDASLNWNNQGSDAGRYTNDDIHAVRIVVMEPTTDRNRGPKEGRLFYSHAHERLRILGEIPVRKFVDGKQPLDPDGNPDTSFLAKIPADTPFTFQTIDKDGMMLNMAQTWHQLRPGEIRNDCGGCHAHSQKPTRSEDTAAARLDYRLADLTQRTSLLTSKKKDESKTKWDVADQTGLRYQAGVKNVEYHRDIRPILQRSCVACHTQKNESPAGNLVLDDDAAQFVPNVGTFPGTYYRLALDEAAKFGHKPVITNGTWRQNNASRYIRKFQSRRSLLTWKVLGRRTDGWTNDDFPTETVPGDPDTLEQAGQPVASTPQNRNRADLDFTGSIMPPPEAVAGTYAGDDGKKIKVEPLSAEDRLTIVRWIDLGCPIDLDFDPADPEARGYGWMCDDTRPTLALTYPTRGTNPPLARILVGTFDYYSGLDADSLNVVADFALDDIPAGENLAPHFKPTTPGVWELSLKKPLSSLASGKLVISVKDRQGNQTRIERVFSVGAATGAAASTGKKPE